MKTHIYLIGFMGTGKTTVSNNLKRILSCKEIDMDALLVEENHMSINEMFDKFGEGWFRDKETELICRIRDFKPAIISCGGGTVMRDENVDYMKQSGTVVLLTAEPETILQRVQNGKDRPLLNGHMNVEYIAQMMQNRMPAYERAADVIVSTDGKSPLMIAKEIAGLKAIR